MTIPILYSRNVNQELYVRALASAYTGGYRVYDPDYALSKEPDPYEKVRKDPVIAAAIEDRLHGIAGAHWKWEPASDRIEDKAVANIFEEITKRCENFLESRYELAQAVILNRSYGYMEGGRVWEAFGDRPVQNWWCPTRITDIDRRRFRYAPFHYRNPETGEPEFIVNLELFSITRQRWETVGNPEWFIQHIYANEEARLGYGRGLLECIYFYHYAKTIVIREGLSALEKFARGILVGRIDGLRNGSKDRTNAQVQAAFQDVLQNMMARHVITMDKNDEVDVLDGSASGNAQITEFLRYFDEAIIRVVTGSVLPMGSNSDVGSNARSTTEDQRTEILYQYDRQLMDASITKCLGGKIWAYNRAQFAAAGLGGARMPAFQTIQERKEDHKLNAEVATLMINAGLPLRLDEVYKRTGWTRPGPDDETIERAAQMPFDPMGGAPGGMPGGEGGGFPGGKGGQFTTRIHRK